MLIFNTILNTILGAKCFLCKKDSEILCQECISVLPFTDRESMDWIFPIYDYTDKNVQKCIQLLKYRHNKAIAVLLAQSIFPRFLEEKIDLDIWHNFSNAILIPIPISKRKRNLRGYNQTEIIAQTFLDLNKEGIKLQKNILIKKRETIPQANIKNRQERLKNPKDSFEVLDQEKVQSKNIILIDDVVTTGATLSEAKKILLKAGAKNVFAFTLAH
ncbi:MAG: hypothetical protein K9L98_00960 [Candidatus Pacebacteria bacterium]|nr:hypothetical protein [Candidatus Paceibacterota bacterium]MCF7862565.1 hypothetical protein [Candidatus Paceibacterota bacterium]